MSEEYLKHYLSGGKQPVITCICNNTGKCAWCYESKGAKRPKTETDSNWDPSSPGKQSVIDSVPTPQSRSSAGGSTTVPPTPSSMGSSTLSDEPNEKEKEVGAILTEALDGHEKATGAELAQRKAA